jgi:DNA-binding beta-propeller fold protein YncE
MFGWVGAVSLSVLALVGCGGGSSGTATLDVVVKDVSMAVVADASVTTTPATKSIQTGPDGHARFAGLAAGAYTVKAEDVGAGLATAQVTLNAGESRALTLILRKADPANGTDGGTDGKDADSGTDGRDGSTDGLEGADGPPPATVIALQDLTKDSNGINLQWSSSATFATYRIYRSQDPGGGYSLIDILNDATATHYRDETVMLGAGYRYRVAGLNSDGSEISSNIQAITAGVFIAINSQVERMKVDPQRPYLYAIDRVNNTLHFVNLTSQTLEKSIFIGSAPTGLDINMAGTELYVANSGSTEIAVVDLTTRAKTRSLLVDTTGSISSPNPYRVVATTGNTLVYVSQDSFSYLKLVSAATGATLATASSSSYGTLLASPDGTHVYTSYTYLTRFDIVGATIKQVDSSSDFSSSSTSIARSGDGTYLFSGTKKVLAANLKSTLGTFPEAIQLANSTGTRAVGSVRVYDGETFTAKATLPLSTTVMAISSDDKTLYLYDTITSRIYLWKTP